MIFGADAASLSPGGMEAGEIRPCIPRPPRVSESVVAHTNLARQLGITQFDGPLLYVQAELREPKRQLVHVAEQPGECDPIVSWKIAPENRAIILIDESANCVADFFPHHSRAVELRPDGLKGPLVSFRPIDLSPFNSKFKRCRACDYGYGRHSLLYFFLSAHNKYYST